MRKLLLSITGNVLLFFSISIINAQTFHNPFLSGSYPDPGICRVGIDYYIANSSFEYFPGIPIWHGKDLINCNNIGFGEQRNSQFNYNNIASSAGI